MKELSEHIKSFIIALACVLTLGSCIFDDYPDDGQSADGPEDPNKAFIVLHISPINMTRAQDNGGVTEKIKSLRIIMLNEADDGKTTIECNELETKIEGFPDKYVFRRTTVPGKKKFYFIANEDEVTNITYPNQQEGDKDKTLKELLKAYTADDDDAENTEDTEAFEEWINSVYFAPTYTINEDKEIYLPYTAFYEGIEVKETDKSLKEITLPDMYLVPVATKFYFSFYNYHENPVEIKELSIKSIASQNFLLGHVGEEDQTKDFNGDDMYWVNWLAEVAKKTQDSQLDNEDVNELYGWISAYQMPKTNEHEEAVLISETNVATIPVWTTTKEPLYLGPYYFPESYYSYKEESNTTQEQNYQLHLYLHDTEVNSATSNDFNDELEMGNVRALFRDTCVLIKITMSKGDVEVYAEIAPWEHKEVYGWADDGSIIP